LTKLRVHDMAGEFGISADEVISLLRTMDVPVRSHLSVLTDEQVARVRARWEREKRARVEKPAAPARRRRSTGVVAAPAAPAAPAPAPVAAEPSARRRRRPAAEVAAAHEAAAAAAAAEAAVEEALEADREIEMPATRHEHDGVPDDGVFAGGTTTAAPDRDADERADDRTVADAATGDAVERGHAPITSQPLTRPLQPPRPSTYTPGAPTSPPVPMGTHSAGEGIAASHAPAADRPRPRPIVPGAPRPKPIATGTPFSPPRPIASAAPGAGVGTPRRDDRRPGPGGSTAAPDRGGRRKKGKRGAVDQEAVDANISKTMSAIRGAPARRPGREMSRGAFREEMEAQRAAEVERERKTVHVNEFITVSELAQILKIAATEIVSFAFKNLGLMVTINQRLDFDQIELIAGEFGFQAVREDEYARDVAVAAPADTPEDLSPRPPVVTIMGHVDHGKTSLLDYIRKANVVAGEAGGITQHIGAYHVSLPGGRKITFLDTPGHEAFTAMRARGAKVTDIVVLVVAADDQVMPQTVEAISHAKNANVPIIVAINKIDLPSANVTKVKQDLLQHGVVVEDFGGNVLSTPISAKKGTNISDLLDQILLQAEILDLKANPNKPATGTVVEAQLDPGKGPVATVLVQNGTLKVGDDFICGMYSGRVRALLDERGKPIKQAGPAIPAQVLGVEGVPMAGDQLIVVDDATESREIAQRRQRLDREAKSRRTSRGGVVTLEDFMARSAAGELRTLRILIKADQGGPAEALADALGQLSNAEVQVEVIHRGVGAITESDILLAKASGAIIVGFHVRPDNNARTAAEREGVDVKLYRIIYEAVADVRSALEGLLRPEEREVIIGDAEVRQIFKVPRVGVIAGCFVRHGLITRQGRVRVIRDAVEVYSGTIGSLKRFKDDVREVREGFECGIGIDNFNDIKVGDVIENFRTEEVARTLESAEQG
jgi:translation initiation factor IF-2